MVGCRVRAWRVPESKIELNKKHFSGELRRSIYMFLNQIQRKRGKGELGNALKSDLRRMLLACSHEVFSCEKPSHKSFLLSSNLFFRLCPHPDWVLEEGKGGAVFLNRPFQKLVLPYDHEADAYFVPLTGAGDCIFYLNEWSYAFRLAGAGAAALLEKADLPQHCPKLLSEKVVAREVLSEAGHVGRGVRRTVGRHLQHLERVLDAPSRSKRPVVRLSASGKGRLTVLY